MKSQPHLNVPLAPNIYTRHSEIQIPTRCVVCMKKSNLANHSCNNVTTGGVAILISKERKVPFEPNAMLNMYMCNYVPNVLTVGQKPVWSIAAAALSVFFGLALSSPYKEENITCICNFMIYTVATYT